MKQTTNTNESLFCEQVQQLTSVYDQWNDCERTVVMYSLFKRLPFANLKFLMHSIETYLNQSFNVPSRLSQFEDAANATPFLNKLIYKYNMATGNVASEVTVDLETITDVNIEEDLMKKYTSKEEIAIDLLMYILLLRPNNDEGKNAYMQFVPVLIEDSIRHNLPIEIVQQILSYLLIHPAIKSEDRK